MLNLMAESVGQSLRVLLLGAHCDDIEIGCGATLLRLARTWPQAQFLWVTLSGDDVREAETRHAARRLLAAAHHTEMRMERFRGSYFPTSVEELKDYFETLKSFKPDLIFTHFRGDLHQDHRVVNELTWNTFRSHTILEYEIPKYDGDLGQPNIFMEVSRDEIELKSEILLDCFPSQRQRQWFTRDTFAALARIRGVECHASEGFAEAFHGRKIKLVA
jgi:LmbE family N-acetylglucosaminyl deacetylase